MTPRLRLKFVGHASVLFDFGPVVVLTDPWLVGEAFNESWALHPPAQLRDEDLERVTHVWISHEHPDHLNIPTLKSLPAEAKARITVLFQKHYSPDVAKFLRASGFADVVEMPHAEFMTVDGVELYCRQVGHLDSCLVARHAGKTILNLNDCDTPPSTLKAMLRDVGPIDVLLTQFSVAGWSGNPGDDERMDGNRRRMLTKFLRDAESLRPRTVIPFASFVRFSHEENAHMNAHVNTIDTLAEAMGPEKLTVMYPGDEWDLLEGDFPGTDAAMEQYRRDFARIDTIPGRTHDTVEFDKVKEAADKRIKDLQRRYPAFLLGRLAPVTFFVTDHARALEVDPGGGVSEIQSPENECMVSVSSQALWYSFAFRWGVPTLGVSGRFVLRQPERPFFRFKKLCSLYSEGLVLTGGSKDRVPGARLAAYLWGRRGDLYSQFLRRVT